MSTTATSAVRLERHGAVAEIVLADPDRGNVVDHAWTEAFIAVLEQLTDDDRAVLLRAEGRAFSFGGDVAGFGAADDPGEHIRSLADRFHDGLKLLAEVEVPVIAAVQGWAAGGGMSLALSADIIVVGEGTRFRTAYNGLGFTADGGMSWLLAHKVPPAVAHDLLLTDRILTGPEAAVLGLSSRLVKDDDLLDESRALAAKVAATSTSASRTVKRLLRDATSASLPDHLDAETVEIAAAAAGPDGREGVAAFLAKRSPDFA